MIELKKVEASYRSKVKLVTERVKTSYRSKLKIVTETTAIFIHSVPRSTLITAKLLTLPAQNNRTNNGANILSELNRRII